MFFFLETPNTFEFMETSTEGLSCNNHYQKDKRSKPMFLCHKSSLTNLFFIQLHADLSILHLPLTGVERPWDYNEVSNKEYKPLPLGYT